jgi:hypothetical protein
LGIRPDAAGFSHVTIRPDLLDLQWAKGAEPTPKGLIEIDLKREAGLLLRLDIPEGIQADVLVPVAGPSSAVSVNGGVQTGTPVEDGKRMRIALAHGGQYEIRSSTFQ